MATENADPNLSLDGGGGAAKSPAKAAAGGGRPPRGGARKGRKAPGLRVSLSPKADLSPGARARRRRSSSHFGTKERLVADDDEEDDDDDDEDEDGEKEEEEEDIEFTLDGAPSIEEAKGTVGGGAVASPPAPKGRGGKKARTSKGTGGKGGGPRRRRRSSARFLRSSLGGDDDDDDGDDDEAEAEASSEHLGEIYRQAIRMNAENKINAGNSWGLKLIENMDKFLVDGGGGSSAVTTPRDDHDDDDDGRADLRRVRNMPSRDARGRVNFAKASCAIDASVKIYSYRVDDVHLSSYRVLANLNRTDGGKGRGNGGGEGGGGEGEGGAAEGGEGGGGGAARRRVGPRTPAETLESNSANINMSKLESAYDIDPLFHKMSKSFDEGGAKGLLLGNLGVSRRGCHVVFDSGEEEAREGDESNKLEKVDEAEGDEEEKEAEEEEEKEREPGSSIDVAPLALKLSSLLASHGHRSPSDVPLVPQLASLRDDYARLEEEGYAVDECADPTMGGQCDRRARRSTMYDPPEEEEREAERSIHAVAMERSRGSVLGMSFDTNFRLSMGEGLGEGDEDGDAGGDFGQEDFGGEGEFAPAPAEDDGDFGGGDGGGGFDPDFGGDDDDDGAAAGGILGGNDGLGAYVDARSYAETKVLLDALCDGDALYDGTAGGGAGEGNEDYAFFDPAKLRDATDGNLWAGSQHWKKRPAGAKDGKKKDGGEGGKRRVAFDDDGEEGEGKKKERKRANRERVYVDFDDEPDVDAIFQQKKVARGRTKKTSKDSYQMPPKERDFLLPPDAGVDASQLSRLFSRPNAVVRRRDGGGGHDDPAGGGKTVGFYDDEGHGIGVGDDDGDFGGGDDGGFAFAYDDGDDDHDGPASGAAAEDPDYRLDGFDEVRKVEKIDIGYATVAKKVDVRRLKRDLWAELEERTAPVSQAEGADDEEDEDAAAADEAKQDDEDDVQNAGEPGLVSFKETVEKMDREQSQSDVTVSFYFICCLHLANEKGLKLDSAGLEDFLISLDDGSAPTFGTFGDGFAETANKLKGKNIAGSRGKRGGAKVRSYVEEEEEEE
ncbi:hypothetical protein ACHAWF_007286 [Thalassiosira exigua]